MASSPVPPVTTIPHRRLNTRPSTPSLQDFFEPTTRDSASYDDSDPYYSTLDFNGKRLVDLEPWENTVECPWGGSGTALRILQGTARRTRDDIPSRSTTTTLNDLRKHSSPIYYYIMLGPDHAALQGFLASKHRYQDLQANHFPFLQSRVEYHDDVSPSCIRSTESPDLQRSSFTFAEKERNTSTNGFGALWMITELDPAGPSIIGLREYWKRSIYTLRRENDSVSLEQFWDKVVEVLCLLAKVIIVSRLA